LKILQTRNSKTFNIMTLLTCSYCEKKFNNINDFKQHISHCRVHLSVQRRTRSKYDEFDRLNTNNDELNDDVFDIENDDDFNMNNNQFNVDDSITSKSSKNDVEEYHQSFLKNKSKILSTSSSVKMKIYEKSINRKVSEWWFWNNQKEEEHFSEDVNSMY
jgi:hypothetical protein